jgi:hypothetical protein
MFSYNPLEYKEEDTVTRCIAQTGLLQAFYTKVEKDPSMLPNNCLWTKKLCGFAKNFFHNKY